MATNTHPYVNDVLRNDPLLLRIWREFAEMPGLCLTIAQAQRLWTIDRATCAELLERLVSARLLVRGGDGRYSCQTTPLNGSAPSPSKQHLHKRAVAG